MFTSDGALQKCDLSKITTDIGWDVTEYMDFFGKELKRISEELFNIVVRFHWLQRRFFYRGYQRKRSGWNNFMVDNAFATFVRHYLKMNSRILTSSFYYMRTEVYFRDFFPEFDKKNPFRNPEYYEFPYKNITIDFLTVVYQMPERLDLLAKAEEEGMSYAEFIDYVVNYVLCYNEEYDGVFNFMLSSRYPPYVRYNLSVKNKKRVEKLRLQ